MCDCDFDLSKQLRKTCLEHLIYSLPEGIYSNQEITKENYEGLAKI